MTGVAEATAAAEPGASASAAPHGLTPEGKRRFFPATCGSGREGRNGVSFRTEREQLCETIWDRVNTTGYIIIIAPYQTGKTFMLQQLEDIVPKSVRYVFVTLLGYGNEFNIDDVLRKRCGGTLQELMDAKTPICICLDSARRLYNEHDTNSTAFWQSVRELRAGKGSHNVRLIMATSHAIQACEGMGEKEIFIPPGIVHPSVTVTIAPPASPVEDNAEQPISLVLTREEDDELWGSFLSWSKLPFGGVVKDFTYRLCGGQPAIMNTCLEDIVRRLRRLNDDQKAAEVLDKNAILRLTSPEFMWYVGDQVRSLHYADGIQDRPGRMAILRQLLWVDCIPSASVEQAALRQLIYTSLVYTDSQDRVCLCSPLHRAHFMYKLVKSSPPERFEVTSNIQECLFGIIKRWDPDILKHALTSGKDGRPNAGIFQVETHRAIHSFSPGHVFAPEAGQGAQVPGSGDFILPAWAMAFEFFLDGYRSVEHSGLGRSKGPKCTRAQTSATNTMQSTPVQQDGLIDLPQAWLRSLTDALDTPAARLAMFQTCTTMRDFVLERRPKKYEAMLARGIITQYAWTSVVQEQPGDCLLASQPLLRTILCTTPCY